MRHDCHDYINQILDWSENLQDIHRKYIFEKKLAWTDILSILL